MTLRTADGKGYIVFSQWSPFNGSMLLRKDFTFHVLLGHEGTGEQFISDIGEYTFIPIPEKEYPPVHFMEIARVGQ